MLFLLTKSTKTVIMASHRTFLPFVVCPLKDAHSFDPKGRSFDSWLSCSVDFPDQICEAVRSVHHPLLNQRVSLLNVLSGQWFIKENLS
jgi:hypothetical protein